jgi:hypothetical protein
MSAQMIRNIDVPRGSSGPGSEFPDLARRRARTRKLRGMGALMAVGESVDFRMIHPDGSAIPSDQLSEQERDGVQAELEHLSTLAPRSLDDLLQLLYEASAYSDRSRIGRALDDMLAYVEYWSFVLPEHVVTLFDRLEPSRLVRAVGQTLLASTKLDGDRSSARQAFIVRFLEDLRIRGTSDAVIARLRGGFES